MASAATNLLDEYLQATSIGRQCTEQAVHCPVPAQTAFLHTQVLQGVHGALDSALAARGVSSSASPTPWGQINQQQAAARSGAWSPDRAASAAKQNASTDSNRMPATPKGLFRAMRQADASALYAEQLAAQTGQPGVISRQQHIQQMEQPPLFVGTDDLTSEVRLLADHAALTSKLQRLQQDMEVRSYRQSLLHRLQQPSALFDQSQVSAVPQQRQQQQAGASTMPRCGSAVMWQSSDSSKQPEPRPCTAPKPSVFKQAMHGTQWGATCAAVSADSAHSRSQHNNSTQRHQQAASQAGSSAACLLASKAPAQMQHLKQLADLELPWKPPAAAGNPKALSGLLAGSYRSAAQQYSRPGSPCGSSRSGSSSGGAHGQRLFLQPDQQQAPSVPRPASAVAALQQSLSELASLKAKYGQQRQRVEQEQQQLRAQQEQRWQQEQHQRSHEQHMRDMRREAWLQEAASAQHATHTLHAAAAGAAAAESVGRGNAARASIWADQDTVGLHGQPSQLQQRFTSSGAGAQGYSRWDAWQQQVHGDRHAQQRTAPRDVAGAAALAAELSQGLLRQQAVKEALQRSKSAPRLHRAWDEPSEPYLRSSQQQQQRSSADDGVSGLGRRSSSPGAGLRGGGLRSSWEDSTLQLRMQRGQHLSELRRPKTAGARVGAADTSRHVAGAGLNAGIRASAGTAAGWLNSSPVKRANRMASVQGAGVPAAAMGAAGARYRPAGAAGTGAAQSTGCPLRTGAGATAGSSWLSASAGGATGRWAQQTQRAAVGSSMATRLRSTTAGVCGVLGTSATQRSWLAPHGAAAQAPVGACKAALLASRAPGAVGAAGAAPGSAAACRQQLVQRALNGYKPQQAARRSTSNNDTSSMRSEDSRPSSFVPATAAAATGSRRESAYAAALARLQAAKQGKPLTSTVLSRGLSTRDDDCSSSSSTDGADDDSSVGV